MIPAESGRPFQCKVDTSRYDPASDCVGHERIANGLMRIVQRALAGEHSREHVVAFIDDPQPIVLTQLINDKPTEIRSFLYGQMAPGRSQELKEQLLKVGVPL